MQKRLKDWYIDPDKLPKVNKTDMAGTIEFIKLYSKSHCVVIGEALA